MSPCCSKAGACADLKLALYGRRGVLEYWLVDWQQRLLDVYRRGESAALDHVATLYEHDLLEAPVLPGFSCRGSQLFAGLS